MTWYRIGCQMPYDARWGIIAKRARMSRGAVLGLFLLLLDFAAQAKPTGSIAGFDVEAAAIVLGTGAGRIAAALREMRARDILSDADVIDAWHFPGTSTSRVRAYRSRRRGDADAAALGRRARLSFKPRRPEPRPGGNGG